MKANKSFFNLLISVTMRKKKTNIHRQYQLFKSSHIPGLQRILKCLTSIGQINLVCFNCIASTLNLGFKTFVAFSQPSTILMSKNVHRYLTDVYLYIQKHNLKRLLLKYICKFINAIDLNKSFPDFVE